MKWRKKKPGKSRKNPESEENSDYFGNAFLGAGSQNCDCFVMRVTIFSEDGHGLGPNAAVRYHEQLCEAQYLRVYDDTKIFNCTYFFLRIRCRIICMACLDMQFHLKNSIWLNLTQYLNLNRESFYDKWNFIFVRV